jgi:putative ABC transport system permease protein
MIASILQDIRYTFRTLRQSPGFAFAAISTIALAIGANTAIFSAVHAVLLRPLPYRGAGELVVAQTIQRSDRQPWGTSPPDFQELRSHATAFEHLSAFYFRPSNLTGSGEPERVATLLVSSEFFATLGVKTALGRGLTREDESWGSHRVALLTDGLWRSRFGADRSILGRAIRLNSQPYVVIGVLSASFESPVRSPQLILPMSFEPRDNLNTRNNYFLTMVGRLRAGRTVAQARAQSNAILDAIAIAHPENKGLGIEVTPLRDALVRDVRLALLVLMGAVGFVLAIACANVANLFLSRALARGREVSIRTALGAGRTRLIRQFLTEGILLAVSGGALGALLAVWGVEALRRLPPQVLPRAHAIEVDLVVLGFTLVLSVAAGVLFGLAPALHAVRLQRGGMPVASSSAATGRPKLRAALVVSEVALSLVLLIGAGLLVKNIRGLLRVDPGFDPENVLTAEVDLPAQKYVDRRLELAFSPRAYARSTQFFGSVIEGIRGLPGVRAVGAVSGLPLAGENWSKNLTFYDRPLPSSVRDLPPIQYRVVAGDYFRAAGIRLLHGRGFTDRDTLDAPLVAVVNQELVRRYWGSRDPLGKIVSVNPPSGLVPAGTLPPGYAGPEKFTIVGVADDARYGGLDRAPLPLVYVPYAQGAEGTLNMFLVLRAASDPLALVGAVREQIWRVDRDQPVVNIATLRTRVGLSVAQPRLEAALLGAFAALALILAAVGIYGLVSYSVSRETREIGIRMALGALPRDLVRMVLGRGMRLAGIGLSIGLVGAVALTRVLKTLLFGVSPTDPFVFGAIVSLLAAVASLASFLPARRAARIDPMVALRSE